MLAAAVGRACRPRKNAAPPNQPRSRATPVGHRRARAAHGVPKLTRLHDESRLLLFKVARPRRRWGEKVLQLAGKAACRPPRAVPGVVPGEERRREGRRFSFQRTYDHRSVGSASYFSRKKKRRRRRRQPPPAQQSERRNRRRRRRQPAGTAK